MALRGKPFLVINFFLVHVGIVSLSQRIESLQKFSLIRESLDSPESFLQDSISTKMAKIEKMRVS